MTAAALAEIAAFFGLLTAAAVPLGAYAARVLSTAPPHGRGPVARLERGLYRLAGVDPAEQMGWRRYAAAALTFNAAGLLAVFALERLQAALPGNPAGLPAVSPLVAWNTAVSFATNTNWQAYGGESTMSHLTQMGALTVQNFLSAATGISVLAALVRALAGPAGSGLGSFWVDLTRVTLRLLLPLAAALALLLAWQGVPQTSSAAARWPTLSATAASPGAEQVVALGPVASQVAVKQLGTNGGGYFNANSAHPYENPTPLSNLLEALSILLVPAALCFAFGALVKDRRQGWTVYSAMLAILVPLTVATVSAEQRGNPALAALGVDASPSALQPGGNMEGKEARLGPVDSAIWAAATTAASNGSVNAAHDSFTALGGLWPLWLMQLGEVVFGGVGSGLYGMLLFAILAVFLAGLMVGRTPEYLGKKVEAYEVKMASLAILAPSATVLLGTAAACLLPAGYGAVGNPGPHGFTELLYALSSTANNNGSAFGGLAASTPFWTLLTGVAMLVGRYWVMLPVLAIAGAFARKRPVPAGPGTLPTHGPLFAGLLVATVLLVGALTFLPALALGPVIEHLQAVPR
ncbi:potassium-transporting ATPase subunit KdpA [Anaeromyxobacter dehalogenans]|uniref:Potassium-transporting ATPase potassium-binding subunit n=1 Tax=Anaeromyxobacter dehalogenans (strain 2CP-C) TaxID=290397 RepID=KDPA_ANADE|nr:potassium-transporting ATPase subunit KdpA [Anaeromyxobacter dehalogenans]Q2IPD5.1 RecName: Full=Potassium-transporting ATPase potassium-binding subunit; AltName: Full=ATP phosphohydrolase [potassium-transporting] A chain; AltName: Full=Potassium-binding and translocating subunit A; AltName: Full=Potassium-translocating ATPase A chain [Anaeromyxobacter dehalogenans 2CP-C]ABC80670.1 potassium-transporting ATPase, A subunit [Anaeromyxobacter dehalogenans 2CP-C]